MQAASADALAALFSTLYHRGQEELLAQLQVAAAQQLGRADVVAQVRPALGGATHGQSRRRGLTVGAMCSPTPHLQPSRRQEQQAVRVAWTRYLSTLPILQLANALSCTPCCLMICQVAWALVRRGAQHVVVHLNARLIEWGEYAAAADIAEAFYTTGEPLPRCVGLSYYLWVHGVNANQPQCSVPAYAACTACACPRTK